MRGKTGGGDRGERVVSGYVHPRRVSFNPGGEGREKLFPWDEEKKGGGEGSCVEARGCACRAI